MDKFDEAIEDIIGDLSDRGGLGNEWCGIDEDIQDEIRDEWASILRNYLNEK